MRPLTSLLIALGLAVPTSGAAQTEPTPEADLYDQDKRLVREKVDEFTGSVHLMAKPIEYGGGADTTVVTVRCVLQEKRRPECLWTAHSLTPRWLYLEFDTNNFEFLVDGKRRVLETFEPRRSVARSGVSESFSAELPFAQLEEMARAKKVRFRLFPRVFEIPSSGSKALRALVARLAKGTRTSTAGRDR